MQLFLDPFASPLLKVSSTCRDLAADIHTLLSKSAAGKERSFTYPTALKKRTFEEHPMLFFPGWRCNCLDLHLDEVVVIEFPIAL